MGARLAAVLVAIGLVLAAVAVRARIDDDGGNGGGRGGDAAVVRIVCATELGRACEVLADQVDGLDVTVEPAGTTADRLATTVPEDMEVDGWLTPGRWPELVDEGRRAAQRPPLFEPIGEPLARSFLVTVVKPGVLEELRGGSCPADGPVPWRCIGDAALGGLRLGGPGLREATAVPLYAALAGSFLNDPDFATNDLRENLDALQWLGQVQDTVEDTRAAQARDLRRLVVTPAVADAFMTTEADWATTVFHAGRTGDFPLVIPVVAGTTPAVLDLVLGVRSGEGGARAHRRLGSDDAQEAIRQAGWRVAGLEPIAGVDAGTPPPEEDDGLPSPGVLHALREVLG